MSNLSDRTEHNALLFIGQIVKVFEQLHYLDMTKEDDIDATLARNLLQGIIESNGYKVNYEQNSKKSILKLQNNENIK